MYVEKHISTLVQHFIGVELPSSELENALICYLNYNTPSAISQVESGEGIVYAELTTTYNEVERLFPHSAQRKKTKQV